MNIEEFRDYCMSVKGASESFPFDENVLVFKVMNKMFAYGSLAPKDGQFRFSMKCDSEKGVELRERYDGIVRGEHTTSTTWNGVCIESDIPDHVIRELVQHSVDEVIKNLPRKKQEEYYGIIHIPECDSTNNYLKNLAANHKADEGTIVYTDFQSSGKGQRGNVWESAKGKNLLFSIILYPHVHAREQFIISQVVSLAVADSLSCYVEDIAIKWPNDIYWKEKKICGILIENVLNVSHIEQSVVGIGININQEKFTGNAPNPVSLRQITGEKYNLFEILKTIREKINDYYLQMTNGYTDALICHYKELLFRRDGYYLYNDGNENFEARIKDIKPDGILVLETKNGTERQFAFKEVKYIL